MITNEQILAAARAAGYVPPPKLPPSRRPQRRRAVLLRLSGLRAKEVAKKMGISPSSVYALLAAAGGRSIHYQGYFISNEVLAALRVTAHQLAATGSIEIDVDGVVGRWTR